ncbi:MAG: hypothetical protein N2Z76_10700 [Treponemataceae bacterium]|nr:hypothetical protein [Treponemataceae bacterium]
MTIKERDFLFRLAQYFLLGFASLITLLPIVVVFFGAFKTNQEFATTGPFEFPHSFLYFENFKVAIQQGNMLLGFWNTLVLLFFFSIGTVLTGTMTAYVLHRFDFTLKNFIRLLFLWITLIPNVTAQVATFQIVQRLGLYNTRLAGIVLSMGTDIIGVYIYLYS